MFYKLLGLLTWKAIKFYLHHKVPTKRLAAVAAVGAVGVIALAVATKDHDSDG